MSRASLQAALTDCLAQATQGSAPGASSKPTKDSSQMALDTQPLIIKWRKKRALDEVVDLETTLARQSTPPITADASSWLKKIRSGPPEHSYFLNDFHVDALLFSLWSPGFPAQQKGDELLKSSFDIDMFKVATAMGIYQCIQAASLCSCTIACHLELRECSKGKAISELKEELAKLRETHSEEICSLEGKVKKAKDKCSATEKEWEAQEKELQGKIASLEESFKEHEDFYAVEVAELKDVLKTKTQYTEGLEGEAVEQYAKGFVETFKQVTFLHAHLDVSSCNYFKEIWDERLVDKSLPRANAAAGDKKY